MKLLPDKRIVITGASMGIGLAVARKCAEQGAALVLISRHEDDLKKAVQGLEKSKGGHIYQACDVSDIQQVKELAEKLKNDFGHIHALVNCAGVYGPIGKIHEIDPLEFINTININLIGSFNMCHYLVPLLKCSDKAKIINYSGGGAAGPFPHYSAYAVSKTGIVRFTENIAMELADDGIEVNAVAPGFVATRLHKETIKAGEKAGKQFLKKTKDQLEQGGVSPDVAANLTVFLLSEAGNGITGKFLSAPWDPWQKNEFIDRLKADKDLDTLRRIDDKYFCVKE